MGRWLAPAATAASLMAVAVWLVWAPPRDGGATQAQLWGGPSAAPRWIRPEARGEVCVLEQVDPTTTSSSLCLSCHDGTAGSAVEFRLSPQDPGVSHPVDVDYGDAHARRPGEYVPPGALPEDVPLVEGKVACVSCHDPASTEPYHVARPASLCNACHVK